MSIEKFLDDARRRLVETGARNRLIHTSRTAARANSLNIKNERTSDVFDLLRVQGKRMRFLATGKDEIQDTEDLLLASSKEDGEDFDPARYRDLFLETALGPENLERRLLRLFTDARTSEEEQGFNILYLAMGFLKWFESPSSRTPREAPLVLMPVRLVRNEQRATFNLTARDEDIVTNLPLQERIRADFGFDLPEIEDTEDWRPEPYLNEISKLVSGRRDWAVDTDGMQLGFFSFAKLLMLRDLDSENWPSGTLEENMLLRGLLVDGFAQQAPLFTPDQRLDERLDPADIVHVVDADASQTKVIEEIRSGRDFVVQGPPGTGKSQTIANIIAAAVDSGKTVLFMAEKMAALNVVHDRLEKVGLGDLCLELHSRTANKRAFAQELAKTLAAGQSAPEMPDSPYKLRRIRDRLNEIALLLHDPVPGYSFAPISAIAEIGRFVGRRASPPELNGYPFLELSEDARRALADRVTGYANLLSRIGPRRLHPFFGATALDLQPTDVERLKAELAEAESCLQELREITEQICLQAALALPETLRDAGRLFDLLRCLARRPTAADTAANLLPYVGQERMDEALAAGEAWRAARDAAVEVFSFVAWDAPGASLRARMAPGVHSFWVRLFGKYRGASAELAGIMRAPLPKAPGERLALVDRLIDVQNKRKILADDDAGLQEALGDAWRGERTEFAALAAVAAWLKDLSEAGWLTDSDRLQRLAALADGSEELGKDLRDRIDSTQKALDRVIGRLAWTDPEGRDSDRLPLDEAATWLRAIIGDIARYSEWVEISIAAKRLEDDDLSDLVAMLDDGQVSLETAADEFLYATAEARWHAARAALPTLNDLAHLDRHELVSQFRDLDKRRFEETRRMLRASHLQQLPTGAYGEMGFLRGEMAKKRRHLPIRRVIQRAGTMLQRIKPVFLMSPISIAQFLPPGAVAFDLLVIDEASQIKPEDALGAIARCGQIAVVGDQKQLPPTSFFDRIAGETDREDEDDLQTARATEMESVLTLCEARGLNNGLLEWHYRSRDPSLIAVNNAEFYDHRLILPPSPVQEDTRYGMSFTRVPGVYSSKSRGGGRPGTNRIEADEIAKRLAQHARTRPDLSVGVVAFSKAQSDMVTQVLEVARRDDQALESLLREDKPENVFVKNIENVQGDERDVILITVGYGPHEPNGGLASMSFGPVNGENGERRLNVLFSRARIRCEIFCSFDPGDIDQSRTSAKGPTVLKRFLEFARSGQLHQPVPTGRVGDSAFEEDVADQIRALGYECDPQVGSAGFRIDLGVRHPDRPGQYILAVECDGATYHSALWARERDRLRQDVLEGMGWRFHRIWSTDWFHRRSHELERLRRALEEAHAAEGLSHRGSNAEGPISPAPEPAGDPPVSEGGTPEPTLSAPPYRRAEVLYRGLETAPHETPIPILAALVWEIVESEGPIHDEEVARRVAGAFGLSRTGRRIQEAVQRAVRAADREGAILTDGPFCMTGSQQQSPPVRDRSNESSPTTRAEYLSPAEIRAAAAMVERESGQMPEEELVVATARLLGFARTGPDVRNRVIDVLTAHRK